MHDKLKQLHYKQKYIYEFNKIFNKKNTLERYKVSWAPIPLIFHKYIISTLLNFMQADYDQYINMIYEMQSVINDGRQKPRQITNYQEAVYTNIDKRWLPFNINLQLTDYSKCYNTILEYLNLGQKLSACDYGCGSGAFMLALNNKLSFIKLDFYDIENYPAEFIRFFIDKNTMHNMSWYNVLTENNTEQYDLVNCLDVLEHLENPFETLQNITSKVKKGGLLNLQIAFEIGDIQHLPQAAENFFVKNDGLKFLNDNYELLKCYDKHMLVSGLYRKK